VDALPAAWGALLDAAGLRLQPGFPAGATELPLTRARFGRTLLELQARRRPGQIVVRLAKRFGPDLGVSFAWGGPELIESVTIDGEPLRGTQVRFLARHAHEIHLVLVPGAGR
jgi:hypothetical protein